MPQSRKKATRSRPRRADRAAVAAAGKASVRLVPGCLWDVIMDSQTHLRVTHEPTIVPADLIGEDCWRNNEVLIELAEPPAATEDTDGT